MEVTTKQEQDFKKAKEHVDSVNAAREKRKKALGHVRERQNYIVQRDYYGSTIKVGISNDKYRENYDRIFRKDTDSSESKTDDRGEA